PPVRGSRGVAAISGLASAMAASKAPDWPGLMERIAVSRIIDSHSVATSVRQPHRPRGGFDGAWLYPARLVKFLWIFRTRLRALCPRRRTRRRRRGTGG